MDLYKEDIGVLRELGSQVAEIAALPVQQEKKRLWKKLNSLQPERPMVMIDQIPWHEMDVNDELTIVCKDEFCRSLEWQLRTILYKWKHMRADMVVEPFIDIHRAIINTGFGFTVNENISATDPQNDVVGHSYIDQIKTEADIEKIRVPEIYVDEEEDALREEMAHSIFDGILDVSMTGLTPTFALWDRIVEWHGVENSIIDLIDRPEFVHKLMRRYVDANLKMIDQLEEKGLITSGIQTIHCTGAYTDELPADGFDSTHPRAKDTWTYGMAQIFSTVSPAMHKEFDIDYVKEIYDRFGLVYYGCCEPLHNKIDIVREIPNLRKISISPWADVEKASALIGKEYVLSRKPSPAFLAGDSFNPDIVENDLKDTYGNCIGNNCPVEYILKDISTVRYKPQRLWDWEKIAMNIVCS